MPNNDTDLEAHIDSAGRLLGLPVTDATRAGILANLRNLAALYDAVRGFDEPEAREPVGTYRP